MIHRNNSISIQTQALRVSRSRSLANQSQTKPNRTEKAPSRALFASGLARVRSRWSQTKLVQLSSVRVETCHCRPDLNGDKMLISWSWLYQTGIRVWIPRERKNKLKFIQVASWISSDWLKPVHQCHQSRRGWKREKVLVGLVGPTQPLLDIRTQKATTKLLRVISVWGQRLDILLMIIY